MLIPCQHTTSSPHRDPKTPSRENQSRDSDCRTHPNQLCFRAYHISEIEKGRRGAEGREREAKSSSSRMPAAQSKESLRERV
ncbi:hypothetical protein BRARA_G00206 [Brassica rapa]|uniref:Uncharacterized protein n=1 Tax=Brassica campestris TaxID=3711 RepID=A0A397YPP5_BRACM|nr:hypothetical protein BRARA_G00206 [Brassica rapa]